jgi:hypothetical protein
MGKRARRRNARNLLNQKPDRQDAHHVIAAPAAPDPLGYKRQRHESLGAATFNANEMLRQAALALRA